MPVCAMGVEDWCHVLSWSAPLAVLGYGVVSRNVMRSACAALRLLRTFEMEMDQDDAGEDWLSPQHIAG
eukprot:gene47909-12220_t